MTSSSAPRSASAWAALFTSSEVSAKCTHSSTSARLEFPSLSLMKYSTAFTSWFVAGMPPWPSRSNFLMICASATSICGSARSSAFSSPVRQRMPTPFVSESAMR